MKKFYRTVVMVEVLSDRPYGFCSLDQLNYDITEGDCSGMSDAKTDEVTPARMAELLKAQGSSPEFFGLNEDGSPLDEE